MILVYDTEADNLLHDATKMHCLVAKVLGEDNWFKFYPDCVEYRREITDLFTRAEKVICHNQIGFDLPLMEKLGILKMESILPKTIDTLVWSSVLYPDRVKPKGISAKAGPHSLEAWAARLGGTQKQQHEDWSTFSDAMLSRCTSDVLINERVYLALLEEKNKK